MEDETNDDVFPEKSMILLNYEACIRILRR
jgi:hypothetical protein